MPNRLLRSSSRLSSFGEVVTYDRTHNIAYLLTRLEQAGVEAPSGISQEELISLSPWAVQFRYDDEAHAVLDRPSARLAIEMTRAWADALLGA
jgi:hypothetical protein